MTFTVIDPWYISERLLRLLRLRFRQIATLLVPPFNIFTTSATLSCGLIWTSMCTWSSCTLISDSIHLFKLHAWYSSCFTLAAILSRRIPFLYLGIHTKWTRSRCFVWDTVQYPAMTNYAKRRLRSATASLLAAIHQRTKVRRFLAVAIKA